MAGERQVDSVRRLGDRPRRRRAEIKKALQFAGQRRGDHRDLAQLRSVWALHRVIGAQPDLYFGARFQPVRSRGGEHDACRHLHYRTLQIRGRKTFRAFSLGDVQVDLIASRSSRLGLFGLHRYRGGELQRFAASVRSDRRFSSQPFRAPPWFDGQVRRQRFVGALRWIYQERHRVFIRGCTPVFAFPFAAVHLFAHELVATLRIMARTSWDTPYRKRLAYKFNCTDHICNSRTQPIVRTNRHNNICRNKFTYQEAKNGCLIWPRRHIIYWDRDRNNFFRVNSKCCF